MTKKKAHFFRKLDEGEDSVRQNGPPTAGGEGNCFHGCENEKKKATAWHRVHTAAREKRNSGNKECFARNADGESAKPAPSRRTSKGKAGGGSYDLAIRERVRLQHRRNTVGGGWRLR